MRKLGLLVALAIGCSSSTDGPTPTIDSIVPAPICDAQKAITVTITGSGFSPVVVDGLTSNPTVEMPRVVLIDAANVQTEVPAQGVSIPDASGTKLTVSIPQGLVQPGSYGVEVIDPDGHTATSSGFVVDAPPNLVSINPASGAPNKTVTLTLTGTGFLPGMTVVLGATPPVPCTNVVVAAGGTTATCMLDLTGVAPGAYDLVVDNGDGCSATLPMGFTVGNEFTLTGIDPPFGCTCSETSVTIGSSGSFASTPRVEMRPHGQATPVTVMKRVAFVDSSTLTAVVPSGLALGSYDVTVIDPPSAPGTGTLVDGFRVVAMPIPMIEQVIPSRGSPQADTVVAIFGQHFRNPVKIELLDRNAVVVKTIASVAPTSATRIDTTLPTTGMTDDAYLVRVTDLDEMTYSTWSAFIVGSTGASGNLHPFTASSALVTGRRMLAGVSARDDLGNTFVYAIAGDSGVAGSVLDTVEVAQLSKFGALSPWRAIRAPNHLTTTRDAPAAVTVPLFGTDPFVPQKTYVYVTGGQDGGGAVLGSIERAVVLNNADAPKITSIASSATAGTLATGTWYYKVSAMLAASDPDNPGGETLASDEEILSIQNGTSAIDLAWSPVTVNGVAAAQYRVYRTQAVNGASELELLIATVSGTTYTDTGAATTAEGPLPSGSLGVWRAQTPTHGIRWGHQAAVITDGTGARFLHVLGGKSNATTGYLATVEVSPIDSLGHLGTFVTTGATAMPTALAFFSLVVETAQNVSGYTGVARMFTLGGVDATGASQEVTQSDIANGGLNGAWAAYGGAGALGTRAGPMCVISSGKLFALGGAGAATSTTFSNILTSGRDVAFNTNGTIGSPIQSTAQSFPAGSPRALGAAIVGSGFIYFVGGTSDGSNATTTTFQTF
ncbi:MAG: hypothetical protein JWO36_2355 [Myxococcales bacterium]|nr:hypothetical protein [Myxococcales bacterium]